MVLAEINLRFSHLFILGRTYSCVNGYLLWVDREKGCRVSNPAMTLCTPLPSRPMTNLSQRESSSLGARTVGRLRPRRTQKAMDWRAERHWKKTPQMSRTVLGKGWGSKGSCVWICREIISLEWAQPSKKFWNLGIKKTPRRRGGDYARLKIIPECQAPPPTLIKRAKEMQEKTTRNWR